MAKVTINDDETPSAALIAEARKGVTVTTKDGRAITLRDPGVLAQFKIIKVLGPETAQNVTYAQMVFPLLYVTSIAGEPVFFPSTEDEIDALIVRLDGDGVATVMKGVQEQFGAADQEAAAAEVKP